MSKELGIAPDYCFATAELLIEPSEVVCCSERSLPTADAL